MVSRLTVRNRLEVRIPPEPKRSVAKGGIWVGLAGSRVAHKVLGVRSLLCPIHHRHPKLDRPKIVNSRWTVNGEFCCRHFFDTIRKRLVSTKADA